jgi:hypothetical protein
VHQDVATVRHQSQAQIIINDLDSLRHRIEAAPAHEEYANVLNAVTLDSEIRESFAAR